MKDPLQFPVRVACIDIGSNGIRGMAAEYQGADRAKVLMQERAAVRLGHCVFQYGSIDKDAMEAALKALAVFKADFDRLDVPHVRAVATSAVRDALNQDQFLFRARKESGVSIDVISGAEEARLVHAAVVRRLPIGKEPWMLMDLGGGSVEVSLVDGGGIQWSESHPMGSVRLLEEFEASKGDRTRFQRLITEAVGTLRVRGKSKALAGFAATGGNIEELARLAGVKDGDKPVRLPLPDLRRLLEGLAKLSPEERMKEHGLRADRADVILPAGLIYEHVARLAGADAIHVPNVGLKEGVLADLVDSLVLHPDARAKSEHVVLDAAVAVGRRYQFEEAHGVHVARLALQMFDQTEAQHGLGPRDRAVLQAAAVLHDVGRFIADKRHHKHSYYLISEAEIPGLRAHEVELAAQVARYHRRKEPSTDHKPFKALNEEERDRVNKLSAILRVADALDRQHCRAVRSLVVERTKAGDTLLHLDGPGDFELESWAVEHKGGLYSRLFDTRIVLQRAAKNGNTGADGDIERPKREVRA